MSALATTSVPSPPRANSAMSWRLAALASAAVHSGRVRTCASRIPRSAIWPSRRLTSVVSSKASVAAGPPSPLAAVASSTAPPTTVPPARGRRTAGPRAAERAGGAGVLTVDLMSLLGATQVPEQFLPPLRDGGDRVGSRILHCCSTVAAAPVLILDQLEDAVREAVDVLGGDEDPVPAAVEDLPGPARAVEAHHREALAHRLDDDHPEALEARAEREDRRFGELLPQLARRAHQRDLLADAALVDHRLQLRA